MFLMILGGGLYAYVIGAIGESEWRQLQSFGFCIAVTFSTYHLNSQDQ